MDVTNERTWNKQCHYGISAVYLIELWISMVKTILHSHSHSHLFGLRILLLTRVNNIFIVSCRCTRGITFLSKIIMLTFLHHLQAENIWVYESIHFHMMSWKYNFFTNFFCSSLNLNVAYWKLFQYFAHFYVYGYLYYNHSELINEFLLSTKHLRSNFAIIFFVYLFSSAFQS